MSTRIYVMTHKEFQIPQDPCYVPLHVGREPWSVDNTSNSAKSCGNLASYAGDNTGDNISNQNCYYSELTGLYWVWKNVQDVDYVGTCHYRRYLLNEKGYVFTIPEIEELLQQNDIITTRNLQLNYSYYEGFGENHKIYYLDETAKVVKDLYPDDYDTYERLVHEKHTYFGNMLICSKALYDEYMEWLFGILFELQSRIVIEEEDSYHRRIFGFLSEFLQYVWITRRGLRVCECMVGMLGEKAETAEIKNALADYFARGDYEGAKNYFLECRTRRPDILMEASDITGELHLCMQVIATAGLEQQTYGTNLLNRMREFPELMHFCNKLNQYTIGMLHREQNNCNCDASGQGESERTARRKADDEDESLELQQMQQWLTANHVSDVALSVSRSMFENHGQLKKLK